MLSVTFYLQSNDFITISNKDWKGVTVKAYQFLCELLDNKFDTLIYYDGWESSPQAVHIRSMVELQKSTLRCGLVLSVGSDEPINTRRRFIINTLNRATFQCLKALEFSDMNTEDTTELGVIINENMDEIKDLINQYFAHL
jgi:hypothetical protein